MCRHCVALAREAQAAAFAPYVIAPRATHSFEAALEAAARGRSSRRETSPSSRCGRVARRAWFLEGRAPRRPASLSRQRAGRVNAALPNSGMIDHQSRDAAPAQGLPDSRPVIISSRCRARCSEPCTGADQRPCPARTVPERPCPSRGFRRARNEARQLDARVMASACCDTASRRGAKSDSACARRSCSKLRRGEISPPRSRRRPADTSACRVRPAIGQGAPGCEERSVPASSPGPPRPGSIGLPHHLRDRLPSNGQF